MRKRRAWCPVRQQPERRERACSRPSPGSPERCRAWPASTRPGPPARFRPARPGGRPRPPNSPNAPACPRGPAPKHTTPWPSCSGNWTASTQQCFPSKPPGRLWPSPRIAAADEPAAATRLREAIGGRSGPRPAAPPPTPEFDVAAEVESLEKDRVRLGGLQWMLDPDLVPEGLFRPGLSPYSDLSVRHEGAKGQVMVEALLAPGADCGALSPLPGPAGGPGRPPRPGPGRLHEAAAPDRVRAELQLPFPLDELPESWIEVVQDKLWPVRSAKGHRIRRALRWADAALRAERAPAGLAPHSAHEDWAALAAAAWERCRRDWEAAGDADRATWPPTPGRPRARRLAPRSRRIDGPAYLAEVLGR